MAAFAATTNAFVGRRDNCCFHLTSSGGLSGDLGQLDDGQVRIGDNSLSASSFCIDANGVITDGAGRGCIITAPTTQFQCDEGATGTSGFSVTSSGKLEFNGNQNFIACQTGQNDGRNVYTTNSTDVTQCTNVQLTADSCSGSSGSGSGSSSGIVSPSAGASATPAPSSVPAVPGSEAPTGAPSSGPGGSGQSTPVAPGGSGESTPVVPGGSGESTAPAGAGESSVPAGTPLPGSPSTVMSTVTVTDCSCSASGGPGGGGSVPGISSVPGSPSGMTSIPSVAPSVPVSSGGSQPSGPAGGGGGVQPSGPASGSSMTSVPVSSVATPSGGGSKPSGSASVPAGSASASASSSASISSTPSSTGASSSCPTDLSGDYEFPHLIVAVDSSSPDKAAGTGYNGTITSSVSSAFNFDIPSSDSGKTCSLVFLFPKLEDLETSSYSFSGDGKIDFAKLSSPVSSSTNANNLPSVAQDLGDITVSPGNSYVVSTFSCPAGETVAYEMKNAGSTDLNFFQDYNPSPLGLYITVC